MPLFSESGGGGGGRGGSCRPNRSEKQGHVGNGATGARGGVFTIALLFSPHAVPTGRYIVFITLTQLHPHTPPLPPLFPPLLLSRRPDGQKKAYVRLTQDYDALDVANRIGII